MMLSLILISPMMKEFDVLAAAVVFVHVLPIESAIGVIIYYREMLQYIDFVCQPLFVVAAVVVVVCVTLSSVEEGHMYQALYIPSYCRMIMLV